MALGDRNRRGIRRFFRSFYYAFSGLMYVVKNEQNMQIHLIGGMAVIGAAWYFSVDYVEWLLLILVIGGVLTVETINTAIERTVDLVTEEYHPLAERAKDISAAGVFVFCLFAVVIGLWIFIPYIIALFQ
nr:diacylglycerol kinase family protein [Shouchella patagoniensis]